MVYLSNLGSKIEIKIAFLVQLAFDVKLKIFQDASYRSSGEYLTSAPVIET